VPQAIGGLLIIFVVFYILWIIAATFVRVFSFLLAYWAGTFLVGALAGVVVGIVLPARVLRGKGKAPFQQITPDALVAGKVISRKPAGPNSEHGWDHAWPNYLPYQATRDAKGVAAETHLYVSAVWKLAERYPGAKGAILMVVGFAALGGYTVGIWASVISWLVIMGVLGLVVAAGQQILLGAHRLADMYGRKRKRATLKCPHPGCYGESTLPGYRCSGPGCTVVHWSMLPGALGLFTRRCSCGTQLPNTVTSAAKSLAPVCPYCRRDLVEGSGARLTIQLALIGSIGAGKTHLLDAATVGLEAALDGIAGKLVPLDRAAKAFLQQARDRISRQMQPSKTPHQHPTGLPFLVRHANEAMEFQVMDVAGEAFANWDETAKLRYLDHADAVLFALDPLALPRVCDQFRRSQFADSVLPAEGDQEAAYGAAIDRMRAESIPVGRRQLAVALTKGDILSELPIAEKLNARDSDSIRSWLIENGSDLLVRRLEKDFRAVRYLVVDSMTRRDISDPLHPWWTFEWLLRESGAPRTLVEPLSALKVES